MKFDAKNPQKKKALAATIREQQIVQGLKK